MNPRKHVLVNSFLFPPSLSESTLSPSSSLFPFREQARRAGFFFRPSPGRGFVFRPFFCSFARVLTFLNEKRSFARSPPHLGFLANLPSFVPRPDGVKVQISFPPFKGSGPGLLFLPNPLGAMTYPLFHKFFLRSPSRFSANAKWERDAVVSLSLPRPTPNLCVNLC